MLRRIPLPTREFVRFLGAGAFNTALGYALFWTFLLIEPYRLAYSSAYAMGVGISYLLNCRFVFRTAPSWRGLTRFPLVYIVQYLLGLGMLAIGVERLHLDSRIAGAIATCAAVPITFVLARWVIRPQGA